jgi:hypothetical protein
MKFSPDVTRGESLDNCPKILDRSYAHGMRVLTRTIVRVTIPSTGLPNRGEA